MSAALILRVEITGQIVADDDGNVGLLISGAIGTGSPSAGISVGGAVTNADTIFNLVGRGKAWGYSTVLGKEVAFGKARDGSLVTGVQLSASVNPPIVDWPEAHYAMTETTVFSLNWLPEWIKDRIFNSLSGNNLTDSLMIAGGISK